jgi:hypothetical protein
MTVAPMASDEADGMAEKKVGKKAALTASE